MAQRQRTILGVSVDDVTMDEALVRAEKMLKEPRAHMIATLNPEILLKATRDADYAAILNRADLALPDGIGLVWVSRLVVHSPLRERVAGVDFMLRLCELASQKGNSVFLLGGYDGIAKKTARVLEKKFPALRITGYSEDVGNWRAIPALFKADVVLVALGAPKQEEWMQQALPALADAKILMGVGGAFDMISGALPRAPVLLQKSGLEWLWRFLLEPKIRFVRICNAVIVFPVKALGHSLFH